MSAASREARGVSDGDGVVVLVSRRFDVPADGAALAAKSLARAYVDAGIAVCVLCELGDVPRPGIEWSGCMCVMRIAPPHESTAGFAVRATQHVCEIAAHRRVLAIECVDEPSCVLAMRAAIAAGAVDAPLISIVTDHASARGREIDAAAHRLADEVHVLRPLCSDDDRARTRQVLLPSVTGVWKPPSGSGPVFVLASAAGAATHRVIADAFAASGLAREGWAVAAIGPTGRWMVSARGDVDMRAVRGDGATSTDDDAVIVVPGDDGRDPVAARLAVAAGCRAVVSDASVFVRALPEHLRDAAVYREGNVASLASALRRAAEGEQAGAWSAAGAQFRSAASPARVVRERAAWWSAVGRKVDRRDVRAAWHEAERALAAAAMEVGR
jgi:hypothetical protein